MGEHLEFGVMRRDEGHRAFFQQGRENRPRERRALLRVGACAQFVQNDERMRIRFFEYPRDVADMRGKRGKRLLDRLLIADIRVHRAETGQFRAGLRGKMQPRLRHERKKPHRFERDGFSACVWACDDEGADTRFERQINRDDGFRV